MEGEVERELSQRGRRRKGEVEEGRGERRG
jgi:hypothetical protein